MIFSEVARCLSSGLLRFIRTEYHASSIETIWLRNSYVASVNFVNFGVQRGRYHSMGWQLLRIQSVLSHSLCGFVGYTVA